MVSARTIKLWSLKVQRQTTGDENTLTLSTRIRRRSLHLREFSTKEARRTYLALYIHISLHLLLLTARNYFRLLSRSFSYVIFGQVFNQISTDLYAYVVYVLGWNGAREEALPFRWSRRCKESDEFQLVFAYSDRSRSLLIGVQLCARSRDSEAAESFERTFLCLLRTHLSLF